MPALGRVGSALMVACIFLVLLMEISLFASLTEPPGLGTAHVSTNSLSQQQNLRSAERHVPSFTPLPCQGCQGPKSLGGASRNVVQDTTSGTTEVQVAAGSATAAGFVLQGAKKPSGMTASARPAISAADRVKKRSLLRARKRAAKDPLGLTWYRGRLVSSRQLGNVTLNSIPNPVQAPSMTRIQPFKPHQSTSRKQPRLRVATVNVGGFDQVTYDSFMQFLTSSSCKLDVVCVQEIHFGLGQVRAAASGARPDGMLSLLLPPGLLDLPSLLDPPGGQSRTYGTRHLYRDA